MVYTVEEGGIQMKSVFSRPILGQILVTIMIGLIIVTNIRLIGITSQIEGKLALIDKRLQDAGFVLSSDHSVASGSLSDMIVKIEWDHAAIRGPVDAPIQIVMFSDFQCPFCAESLPVLERVMEKYQGKVVLAYRHFPLPGHTQAMIAAEASECAREQGKFWEMHDLIFKNQPDLAFDSYRKFAQEIGVDMTKFDECMSRHRYEELILTDIREGRSYGVSGTPTFFINGYRVLGAADIVRFEQIIEQLLTSTK